MHLEDVANFILTDVYAYQADGSAVAQAHPAFRYAMSVVMAWGRDVVGSLLG
jgi:hypothetical protein